MRETTIGVEGGVERGVQGGVKGGVGGVKGGVEGGAQVSILGKFVDKPAGKYSGGNKRKLCFRVSLRDP